MQTACAELMGTADHVAIQRAIVLRLFANFDRFRHQLLHGAKPLDPEEVRALGSAIATAVAVLQETIAERDAPVAEPVAA
jgi:hypothetical protein